MEIGALSLEQGAVVHRHRMVFSPIADKTKDALRLYEPRLAPSQLHVAFYDPDTRALVSVPRAFDGRVDKARIRTPEADGQATAEIELTSTSRDMIRWLPLKRSDESYKLRSGDRIGRYADVSGQVGVWWAEAPLNQIGDYSILPQA